MVVRATPDLRSVNFKTQGSTGNRLKYDRIKSLVVQQEAEKSMDLKVEPTAFHTKRQDLRKRNYSYNDRSYHSGESTSNKAGREGKRKSTETGRKERVKRVKVVEDKENELRESDKGNKSRREVINVENIEEVKNVEDIINVKEVINVEDIIDVEEINDRRININKEVNIEEIDSREINKEVKLGKEKLNGKEINQNNFERKVGELGDGQATSEVDTRKPALEGKILEIIKYGEYTNKYADTNIRLETLEVYNRKSYKGT
ncbi:hypothetical protein M0802_012900 [Mischocyttarus mexicanus]|nr:hypothetical protein M0802_012900 [Mischocyttarus mexicanus]